MIAELKVGAKVKHEGSEDWEVTAIHKDKGKAVFENERYRVLCLADELVFNKEGGFLYLPGRDLSKRERAIQRAAAEAAARFEASESGDGAEG